MMGTTTMSRTTTTIATTTGRIAPAGIVATPTTNVEQYSPSPRPVTLSHRPLRLSVPSASAKRSPSSPSCRAAASAVRPRSDRRLRVGLRVKRCFPSGRYAPSATVLDLSKSASSAQHVLVFRYDRNAAVDFQHGKFHLA